MPRVSMSSLLYREDDNICEINGCANVHTSGFIEKNLENLVE